MNLNELVSTLRLMGWVPRGGGILTPPITYSCGDSILLIDEDQILIGNTPCYTTNEETLKHIMEYTDD